MRGGEIGKESARLREVELAHQPDAAVVGGDESVGGDLGAVVVVALEQGEAGNVALGAVGVLRLGGELHGLRAGLELDLPGQDAAMVEDLEGGVAIEGAAAFADGGWSPEALADVWPTSVGAELQSVGIPAPEFPEA